MSTSPRIVAVALAATLVFAACGSDDAVTETTAATTPATTEDAAPETTDATEPTTLEDTSATTEVATQDVEADSAAAQAALLTLAELPEGWTEAPGGDAADLETLLADCVGADSLTSAETGAGTGTFASPDGAIVVTQRVGVLATDRDARNIVAQMTTPAVPDCIAAAFTTAGAAALTTVADDATIGDATATRLAVGAAGDATQAVRVTVPVTSADAAATVTVDVVIVRAGRSLSALTVEASLEPAAVETIDEITAAAASRLPS